MERKLAKIIIIDAIHPIENADNIEVAQVGGWKVVVKKGEFKPLQKAVYFEIDSWIPEWVAPLMMDFLAGCHPDAEAILPPPEEDRDHDSGMEP